MERTIITPSDTTRTLLAEEGGVVTTTPTADTFLSRVMKAIPAEIVGLYLFAQGIIASAQKDDLSSHRIWLWVMFGIGFVLTPIFLVRVSKVRKPVQVGISTAAFAIWVFAIGGPFALYSWYQAFIGTILLAVFATVMYLFPQLPQPVSSGN